MVAFLRGCHLNSFIEKKEKKFGKKERIDGTFLSNVRDIWIHPNFNNLIVWAA